MPLTDVQVRVDRWSKVVLLASTVLLVYSTGLFFHTRHHHPHHPHSHLAGRHHGHPHGEREGRDALSLSHSHGRHEHHRPGQQPQQRAEQAKPQPQEHDEHHGKHHHHGPRPVCAVHHFALLGMLTGFTGIVSAFINKRGCALIFLVLVLVSEFAALGALTAMNAAAVEQCQRASEREVFSVEQTTLKIGTANVDIVKVQDTGKKVVDTSFEVDCLAGVKHAATAGAGIIGVIAVALACCAARHASAIVQSDVADAAAARQEQQELPPAPVLVEVDAEMVTPVAKEQPVLIDAIVVEQQ